MPLFLSITSIYIFSFNMKSDVKIPWPNQRILNLNCENIISSRFLMYSLSPQQSVFFHLLLYSKLSLKICHLSNIKRHLSLLTCFYLDLFTLQSNNFYVLRLCHEHLCNEYGYFWIFFVFYRRCVEIYHFHFTSIFSFALNVFEIEKVIFLLYFFIYFMMLPILYSCSNIVTFSSLCEKKKISLKFS